MILKFSKDEILMIHTHTQTYSKHHVTKQNRGGGISHCTATITIKNNYTDNVEYLLVF